MPAAAMLLADASVDTPTGAAGWSAWIQPPGARPFWQAGRLHPINVNQAELQAIHQGLQALSVAGCLSGEVVIMSDSMTALSALLVGVPGALASSEGREIPRINGRLPDGLRGPLRTIRRMLAGKGVTLQLQHVKGHQTDEAGGWVNQTVDWLARAHMRQVRDQNIKPGGVE